MKMHFTQNMFQITNSSYRFRKKTLQSKTCEVQESFSLGQTQSSKLQYHVVRASQNISVNLSTPKNPKILPKLQKTFLFPHYPIFPNRYLQTPSLQPSIAKYQYRQTPDSEENRNIFYRSQKNKRIQKMSGPKLDNDKGMCIQVEKDSSPKYFAVNKKGKRPYNQDRYICKQGIHKFYFKNHLKQQVQKEQRIDLYAVFDGHGGSACAQFLKDNFLNFLIRTKNLDADPQNSLKQAFSVSQQNFIALCESKKLKTQTSGACAISCVVMESKVIVGSVGDCRAIMFNKEYLCQMTKDHKPTQINQKMRIIKCGGKVYKQQAKYNPFTGSKGKIFSATRIAPGNLNVSRTLGDIETKLKKYGGLPGMISPQPDIKTFDKQNYEILLLASDGLFEAFTNSEIQRFYYNVAQSQLKSRLSPSQLARKFLDRLIDEALLLSTDNITIIVVPLAHNK